MVLLIVEENVRTKRRDDGPFLKAADEMCFIGWGAPRSEGANNTLVSWSIACGDEGDAYETRPVRTFTALTQRGEFAKEIPERPRRHRYGRVLGLVGTESVDSACPVNIVRL